MPEVPKNYLQIRIGDEYHQVHPHVINDIRRILEPYAEFKTPVPVAEVEVQQPKAKGKLK